MVKIEKQRRKHDRTKKRKYVKSGFYKIENAEDFVPESWWRRYERDKRVVEATLQLLREAGPRRFTVTELARRLQMHRSTIYYSYGCKAELLEWVREQSRLCSAAGQLTPMIQARIDAPVPPGDDLPPTLNWLRSFVVQLMDDLLTQEGPTILSDLWLLTAAERLRSVRKPSKSGRLRFGQRPATHLMVEWTLRRFVAGAVETGELPADAPVDLLVAWIVGLVWYYLAVRGPSRDLQHAEAAPAWRSLRLDYGLTCLLQGARQTAPLPMQASGAVTARGPGHNTA